jgi:hypothetical protein
VGKPEENRQLERPSYKCVDNIKMNLIDIRWGGKDWLDLAKDRDQWKVLENTVMNFLVP